MPRPHTCAPAIRRSQGMSFLCYKRTVEEGDTAILCRGREKIFPVKVERGKVVQIRGGSISHDSLIGVQYGSKVMARNGKSWVLLLHPTPELWTAALPHRTQIIYSTDISLITMLLDLRPGSVVCECGTGSGSLSHAIVRTAAPNGHLYTFEFHQQRAKQAEDEFREHGLSELVSIECRDVCQEGFGMKNIADAVFLDMPSPWEAIDSAKEALKLSGGRLVSFSPCIEQVQRTCKKMAQADFVEIEVTETLLRPFDVRSCIINVPNLGFPQASSTAGDGEQDVVAGSSKCKEEGAPHTKAPLIPSSVTMHTAAQHGAITGHTGYITSATLYSRQESE